MVYHLGKVPRDAVELVLSPLDPTLKSAVGEGVAFVEVQVALISEEAVPSAWGNTPKVFGSDQGGREVDEVLSPWLEVDTLLSHHRELIGSSNEEPERTVAFVKSAEGHCARVKIQC